MSGPVRIGVIGAGTIAGLHLAAYAQNPDVVVAGICDVDADRELRRRYSDQVPVTFVDGVQHDFWRVDPRRLRAALARRR